MLPRERRETGTQDLFRSRLDQIINMNHEEVTAGEDGIMGDDRSQVR